MKQSKAIITVQETTISVTEDNFVSLTDIAKKFNPEEPITLIKNWMRTKDAVNFLGTWEKLNNPDFKLIEFDQFRMLTGDNNFVLSPTRWITATGAIGIRSKAGRYGGGTFAHKDIALAFCYWLSPEFQVYVIQEFQRLKKEEAQNARLSWSLRRELAKINYPLHTHAVKDAIDRLQLGSSTGQSDDVGIYASEADVLNVAVFGCTAQVWRSENPEKKGNIRDHATIEQLHVLANMESYNAILLRNGCSQQQRIIELARTAAEQLRLFEEINIVALERLHSDPKTLKNGTSDPN